MYTKRLTKQKSRLCV